MENRIEKRPPIRRAEEEKIKIVSENKELEKKVNRCVGRLLRSLPVEKTEPDIWEEFNKTDLTLVKYMG